MGISADTSIGLLALDFYRNEARNGYTTPTVSADLINTVYVAKVSDLLKANTDNTIRLGLEYRHNAATGQVFGGMIGYTVAAEVKTLAVQTAQATEEIADQIGQIQDATTRAVGVIGGVAATVEQMSSIAAFIACAVEEQDAATSEIARNVQQLASSTNELMANTAYVSHAAGATGIAASQVLGSAEQLAGQAELLESQVVAFLASVRAA